MTARCSTATCVIDMRDIAPQITWGTSPEQVLPVTGRVPDPADAPMPRSAAPGKPRSPIWG